MTKHRQQLITIASCQPYMSSLWACMAQMTPCWTSFITSKYILDLNKPGCSVKNVSLRLYICNFVARIFVMFQILFWNHWPSSNIGIQGKSYIVTFTPIPLPQWRGIMCLTTWRNSSQEWTEATCRYFPLTLALQWFFNVMSPIGFWKKSTWSQKKLV